MARAALDACAPATAVPTTAPAAGRHPPWLSVLMPAFTASKTLRRRIAAIAAQAGPGVEVLILDAVASGSFDRLRKALDAEWPGRLQWLRAPGTRSRGAACNALLDAACGRYVWLLDGSDELLPGAVAELAAVVDRHDPDLVLCDSMNVALKWPLPYRRTPLRRLSFGGRAGVPLAGRWDLVCRLLSPSATPARCLIARRSLWNRGLRFPAGDAYGDLATLPRLALRAQTYFYAPVIWTLHREKDAPATLTPEACDALSSALLEFCREFRSLPPSSSEALFRVSHACARNFVEAAAHAFDSDDPQREDRLGRYRREFKQSTPIGARQLLDAYEARGWDAQWARLAYWLERCRREPAPPARPVDLDAVRAGRVRPPAAAP